MPCCATAAWLPETMCIRSASLLPLTLLVMLLLWAVPAAAETVYVTDRLLLGLYAERGDQGQRLKLLTSGTALEVVERQGAFARVRSPEDIEGWVKTAFLVDEKPAALRVAEMEQEAERLNREIERLMRNSKAALSEELQQRLGEAETALADAQDRVQNLEDELVDLRELEQRVRAEQITGVLWIAGAAVVSLLIGALAGYRLYDRRLRERFSGMRID